MARALPVSPDLSVLHPSFSALASLGLEESVLAITDAAPSQAPQLVPLLVPVEPSLESMDPVQAATPVAPLESMEEAAWSASADETLSPADVLDGQVTQSPSDPIATMIWVPIDLSVDARGQPVVAEYGDDLSFLDRRTDVEFRSDGFGDAPDFGAESMPFDAAAAARGGGGGGSGGGGGGSGGVVTEYKAGSANDTEGYDILIQFKGTGWTAGLQTAFKDAANYFTTVITDDIGGGGRIGKVIVDDLYVTAEVKTIDGAGGILGQAGPSSVWTASQLTAAGQMQFDVADALDYLGQGLWDDIVTHEMMHVLGFGTLWNYGNDADLVTGFQYTGAAAVDAYELATGETHSYIPVENTGGSGTAGSHWDEEALGNELMTGYINNTNYLSEFSVMSLADLGYMVSYQEYQPLIT